jgi:hypothetical protein
MIIGERTKNEIIKKIRSGGQNEQRLIYEEQR